MLNRIYLLTLIMICLSSQIFSQLNHYIYLQTDNQQPFYVKYNNKIYSSTASGYLILSKIKEGSVDFSIGFPKSQIIEQKIQLIIDNLDKGYLIKDFSEKGWGLFDLQTSAVVYAGKTEMVKPKVDSEITTIPVTDDPFANMLSKVTNDSTVKNVRIIKEKPEVKEVPAVNQVIVKEKTELKETPAVNQELIKQEPEKTDSIKSNIPEVKIISNQQENKEEQWIPSKKSEIQQINKFISNEGVDFVFKIINNDGNSDTVRFFINKEANEELKNQQTFIPAEKKDSIEIKKTDVQQPSGDNKVINVETPQQPVNNNTNADESKMIPNSNCKSIANDEDFVNLRRRMVNEPDDEKMINEAKKIFKTKCFSTNQIKNLAVLFLNDKGRYLFYEAALTFVTDFPNFRKLEDSLTDEQYKNLFKALLPN